MDEKRKHYLLEQEKKKMDKFYQENTELVGSALGLLGTGILLSMNQFNSLDRVLGKIIATHYIQDENQATMFANEVMNTGDIMFGTKVKLVEKVLGLKSGKLQKLRECSNTRNNLLHSIYGLDPDFLNLSEENFVITLSGRNGKEDSLALLEKFKSEYTSSREQIIELIEEKKLPILKEELADVE